jgi:predicted transcriptional regulator
MLAPELAARVLSFCNQTALPVTQLSSKMGGNHEKLIDLIRELQARGLLLRTTQRRGKGRPQNLLRTTSLGKQFIEQYDRLMTLRLHSNDKDIKKALHQAELTLRLIEQRVSPYARFREVNELARNIASTAQTSRNS